MNRYNYILEQIFSDKTIDLDELRCILNELIKEGWSKQYLLEKFDKEFKRYYS